MHYFATDGVRVYFVNVNQIIDLGRFEMGIVSKIKDFDNAPSELVQVVIGAILTKIS